MKNYLLILTVFLAVFVTSCKEKEEPTPDADPTLKLEGIWTLEKLNFLDDKALWNDDIVYNGANSLAFAPTMYETVQGFDFRSNEIESGEGKILALLNEGDRFANLAEKTWYWNYLDNNESFEIGQVKNPAAPPYDFGISNIKDIEIKEKGDLIIFKGELNSRVLGTPPLNTVKVSAEFTMKKGTPTKNVDMLYKGAPYVLPK